MAANYVGVGSRGGRRALASARARRELVLWVGSGASIWKPSCLPSGQSLSAAIVNALMKGLGFDATESDEVASILATVPFEVLMNGCPDIETVLGPFLSAVSGASPNPVHEAVSKLVEAGCVTGVITTNYDAGLDRLPAFGLPTVVREADVPRQGGRCYFKIHGCAAARNRDTVVCTLDAEGALPAWKASLLRRMVRNRDVLLLGYSGVDFDLCPVLAGGKPRSVLWNFRQRSDAASLGWREVAERLPSTAVIGDLRVVLGELLGRRVAADLATGPARLGRIAAAVRRLWAARTHVALGLGMPAARALGPSPRRSLAGVASARELLTLAAQSRHFCGQYRDAADMFFDAARLARGRDRHALRLSAADVLIQFGDQPTSRRLVAAAQRYARRHGDDYLLAQSLLKSALLHKQDYYDARTDAASSRELVAARNRAVADIRQALPIFRRLGDIYGVEQLHMEVQKVDACIASLNPVSSRANGRYGHLGYFYASVVRGRTLIEKRSADAPGAAWLGKHIASCRVLRIPSEHWKLLLALAARSGRMHDTALMEELWGAFESCQYLPAQRVRLMTGLSSAFLRQPYLTPT